MESKWYMVHCYSNFEKYVANVLMQRAKLDGMLDLLEEVYIPMEKVIEVKRQKKVTAERRIFPGYVMVKGSMNDKLLQFIKATPKVTDVLGSDKAPIPLSDEEVEHINKLVSGSEASPQVTSLFEIGEQVKIIDGPFESFAGVVEEFDPTRAKLKVSVGIFGRTTSVELEASQVKKA